MTPGARGGLTDTTKTKKKKQMHTINIKLNHHEILALKQGKGQILYTDLEKGIKVVIKPEKQKKASWQK
jgi:hypothetical protein